MKIELLEDYTCKEVKAAYNADKHAIGVTVTGMPKFDKNCTVTVLVISNGKTVNTYQQLITLLSQCDSECEEEDGSQEVATDEVKNGVVESE